MDRELYTRTISSVVDYYEGYETLALILNVNVDELRRWADGRSRPPTEIFLRIVDLARQMIELSGKTPDVDIAIEFSGLKQGEKIAEILSDEGEEVRPCIEGIMELIWRPDPHQGALKEIMGLVEQSRRARNLPEGSVLEAADKIRLRPLKA